MEKEKNAIITLLNCFKEVNQIELSSFDSGAYMIDFRIQEEMYCIQLWSGKFGISVIENEPDFSTVPDNSYDTFTEFEKELKVIICGGN